MAILFRTKQAQQWRSARMERFAQIQLRKREWLNFEEIAELCSELNGSGVANEAARENACRNLERDLLSGDFEEKGRSRVLYLHPSTVRTRMTREWYQDAIEYNYDGCQGRSQFLPWCWISRSMYERWAAKHYLPSAPPRFQQLFTPAEYCLEGKSPDSIDGVAKANQPTAKSKPGAKPRWDWEDIELFVRGELDRCGDLADPQVATKGWQSLSDLYVRVITYVEGRAVGGGEGSGPAISTLKDHVPEMIVKWRAQRQK
jgi:hypothetical protein